MKLYKEGLKDHALWEEKGYQLPKYNRERLQMLQRKIRSGYILVQEIFSAHSMQT